jgi:hypothetical protein
MELMVVILQDVLVALGCQARPLCLVGETMVTRFW